MGLKVNQERLQARLDHMAGMTVPDKPWERTAFSDLHKQGRAWLTAQMQEIGLETRLDAAANLIGILPGTGNGLGSIAVGSHSDTVPSGGRYDGVAGVMAALEIAQVLREAGHRLRHQFEAIDFLAEEPNQYGISCVGSRAMAGELTPEILAYAAPDGSTLADGISDMGGDPDALAGPLRKSGDTAAFLEMHIEQARVLESAGEDIGAVTGIAGIIRIAATVSGIADHSGATPMNVRRDALTGASEMLLAFETKAKAEARAPMVATVGKLDITPNAANAVPGQAAFTLEIRSGDNGVLTEFRDWALAEAERIAKARNLGLDTRVIGESTPSPMNDKVQTTILKAAKDAGFKARKMPSGAGHDAAYMARIAPAGMAFIPCLEGRSHCPEEFATAEQVAKGAQVLLDAVLRLDQELD